MVIAPDLHGYADLSQIVGADDAVSVPPRIGKNRCRDYSEQGQPGEHPSEILPSQSRVQVGESNALHGEDRLPKDWVETLADYL